MFLQSSAFLVSSLKLDKVIFVQSVISSNNNDNILFSPSLKIIIHVSYSYIGTIKSNSRRDTGKVIFLSGLQLYKVSTKR